MQTENNIVLLSPDISKLSPGKIAELADKAAIDENHAEAERLYLLAAAKLETISYQAQPKQAKAWDKAAARQRRLADIGGKK
jgi:hypothetical protein